MSQEKWSRRIFRRFRRETAQVPNMMENNAIKQPQKEQKEQLPNGITLKDRRSGLLVAGWDGIQKVLEEYARLHVPIDNSAVGPEQMEVFPDLRRYAKAPGGNEYEPPIPYSSEEFVGQFVMKALQEHPEEGIYFGYTGNTFQKTSIHIERPKDTTQGDFILHIEHQTGKAQELDENNAIEEELAKRLGIEHVLRSRSISIPQPNDGEKMIVDAADLGRKLTALRDVFGYGQDVTAAKLQQHFFHRDKYNDPQTEFYFIGVDDGIHVTFGFQNVGEHYNWQDKEKTELWNVDGTTWIIPLNNRLISDKRPSGFTFYLSNGATPIIADTKKQTLDAITSRVITQFGSK